jgi:hypothetical protein
MKKELLIFLSIFLVMGLIFLIVKGPGNIFIPSEGSLEAKTYWDKTVHRCGDFYYGTSNWQSGVAEFKDFSYSTTNIPLTEADKLSGYEWKVESKIESTAFRFWNPFWRRWIPDWRNGSPNLQNDLLSPPLDSKVLIFKLNSEVFYNYGNFITSYTIKAKDYKGAPFDCSMIPQK